MSKQVVGFYLDRASKDVRNEPVSGNVRNVVMESLGADACGYVWTEETVGFQSSVDWDALYQEGYRWVVLVDVNDACAYGIKLEAENAGIKAYEFLNNELYSLEKIAIVGKQKVPLLVH